MVTFAPMALSATAEPGSLTWGGAPSKAEHTIARQTACNYHELYRYTRAPMNLRLLLVTAGNRCTEHDGRTVLSSKSSLHATGLDGAGAEQNQSDIAVQLMVAILRSPPRLVQSPTGTKG